MGSPKKDVNVGKFDYWNKHFRKWKKKFFWKRSRQQAKKLTKLR